MEIWFPAGDAIRLPTADDGSVNIDNILRALQLHSIRAPIELRLLVLNALEDEEDGDFDTDILDNLPTARSLEAVYGGRMHLTTLLRYLAKQRDDEVWPMPQLTAIHLTTAAFISKDPEPSEDEEGEKKATFAAVLEAIQRFITNRLGVLVYDKDKVLYNQEVEAFMGRSIPAAAGSDHVA